jgi:hypothetical protein
MCRGTWKVSRLLLVLEVSLQILEGDGELITFPDRCTQVQAVGSLTLTPSR